MKMATKTLHEALLAVQSELEGVSRDSTNPHFKSKYADLTAVLEAVVPVLNKHGIYVVQCPVAPPAELASRDTSYLALLTSLVHVGSGFKLESVAVVPLVKNDPQSYAASLTYARRVSLGSIVGLKFLDDDGEEAMGRNAPARPQPQTGPKQGQTRYSMNRRPNQQTRPTQNAAPSKAQGQGRPSSSPFPDVEA